MAECIELFLKLRRVGLFRRDSKPSRQTIAEGDYSGSVVGFWDRR
jgi:hypothetical protein